MNKIPIIISREYLSRVKKRSFIIMTILGPILMAAMMIVPVYIAQMSDELKTIAVVDDSGIFYKRFADTDNIKFEYLNETKDQVLDSLESSSYYAVLYLPEEFVSKPSTGILYYQKSQPSITVKSYIETVLKKEMEAINLKTSGISKEVIESINTNIDLNLFKFSGNGFEEKSSTEVSTALGMFAGIMIYMFIFLFGTQVMRGVIEEKTSRIIEVIISSVKPFQLMLGKIIGIALVGLTQFLLWIVLTFGIYTVVQSAYPETFKLNKTENPLIGNSKIISHEQANELNANHYKNEGMRDFLKALSTINFGVMIMAFIFYFLFGYLLYAALFAAVGSAVDSEADTQQFMLPITIPLVFALLMSNFVINNPNGPVAFWLSIIPFTSPIIMMIRIPFGVPILDQVLSYSMLILGFLFCTWLAGKIYRTGILMYGKKVNYQELWKWITYKG
ncbi:MAG TPA: ABC transporter permease [Bacteroidales bacterium]|nr:ABC transporter permease [Bacteroidales bacterium]HPS17728.1 ABC transporter permease [Bacteroidales bacterium]